MQILGEWLLCDDGITRPTVRAVVHGASGVFVTDDFLIDSGADRTVFSATLFSRLGLPTNQGPTDYALSGIGGVSGSVLASTVIEFTHSDGGPARVRGEFAAFTDPLATDICIPGRDVLDNFDLILSRRRDEIHLLAPNHQYQVI
jgi:hypothetical protein